MLTERNEKREEEEKAEEINEEEDVDKVERERKKVRERKEGGRERMKMRRNSNITIIYLVNKQVIFYLSLKRNNP